MSYAVKFLKEGAVGPHSGFQWSVPNGKPGAWVHARGDLVACENGIHACGPDHLLGWLNDEAYLIELGGRVFEARDKLVARKGRLVRRLEWEPRLFAADCAERVLPIFEKEHPNDDRPRKAIEAARAYARGEIGVAARDAARVAAWDAARDAARVAARVAAGVAAGAAARAAAGAAVAARAAAGAAARDAARDAAWAAARAAQRDLLLAQFNLTEAEREGLNAR